VIALKVEIRRSWKSRAQLEVTIDEVLLEELLQISLA